MTTTKELIARAVINSGKASERLQDGRIVTATVGIVKIPGVRNHARAFFYVDGKRVTRATAAIILRNDKARQEIRNE